MQNDERTKLGGYILYVPLWRIEPHGQLLGLTPSGPEIPMMCGRRNSLVMSRAWPHSAGQFPAVHVY